MSDGRRGADLHGTRPLELTRFGGHLILAGGQGKGSRMGRPSKYPEDFRREAVALALSSDDSRASVARRLGVNETTLRSWVADHLAAEARQADPLAVTGSEFEELRRLRREVAELRTERAILRKAAAYFAQETIRSAASGSSPSTDTSTASSDSAGSWESHDRGSTPGSAGRPRRGR
jgi:transposase